jgi:hypothetical protein
MGIPSTDSFEVMPLSKSMAVMLAGAQEGREEVARRHAQAAGWRYRYWMPLVELQMDPRAAAGCQAGAWRHCCRGCAVRGAAILEALDKLVQTAAADVRRDRDQDMGGWRRP